MFVITQTSHYEHDYDFILPNYSVVTEVYIEDGCFVALSDSKCFKHKKFSVRPMTVKEVINELSKYSSDLEVQTEVFDSIGFLCDGLGDSIIDDIVKVSCDEANSIVILNEE